MGAALTYARRYALFTGPDCRREDAPGLALQTVPAGTQNSPPVNPSGSDGSRTYKPAKSFQGGRTGTMAAKADVGRGAIFRLSNACASDLRAKNTPRRKICSLEPQLSGFLNGSGFDRLHCQPKSPAPRVLKRVPPPEHASK